MAAERPRTMRRPRPGPLARLAADRRAADRIAVARVRLAVQYPGTHYGPDLLTRLAAETARAALAELGRYPAAAGIYLARVAALAVLALERLPEPEPEPEPEPREGGGE
jgi:hypothetical protein